MKFDLLIDGKAYSVELRIGNVATVCIDGERYQLKTTKTKKGITVQLGKKKSLVRFEGGSISVDSRKHDVEVRNLRRGRPSWSYSVADADNVVQRRSTPGISTGEGMIHAPMPGRVVSIKVKVGDSVKTGTPLLVLEAMKMQNEIASDVEGIVREVRVSEGVLVESREVLVVIGS